SCEREVNAMWRLFQPLLGGEARRKGPRRLPQRNRLSQRLRRCPGLEIELLENRLTPASFFYNQSFGNLSIQLDTGQDLTVAESGGTRTFTLSNGRWYFLGVNPPTSVDGDTLTFGASKNLGGVLAIAGGPYTNNVTFA